MAERSWFFNAEQTGEDEYDRVYLAEDFAKYFSLFISNGVFPNPSTGLQVLAQTIPNMTVTLKPGFAFINGYGYENTSDYVFTIDTADGVLNREDSIFIRWYLTDRKIAAYKAVGTPGAEASHVDLIRTKDYWDLCVARITVEAGVTSITQSAITDTRLNTDLCGIVATLVDQVDTTTLYNQIQADLEEFQNVSEEDFTAWYQQQQQMFTTWYQQQQQMFNTWYQEQQSDFDEWFDDINSKLGTEPATALQQQIDEINTSIEESSDRWFSTYHHVKNGTTHIFSGSGSNGKVKMTADVESGDTVKVSWMPQQEMTIEEETIQAESLPAYYGTEDFVTALAGEEVAGKWFTFTNDGTQLNFKGGGGVGVSKLAATTAVPADVVQGKTFYSKDKTLKTGTLTEKSALTDAVSVDNDGSYLYARIPVGAYRAKQATGYPEIRFPNSDAIENIPGGDNGAWSGTYSGSNVTIPKGYHNGNGSVGVAGGNRGNWNGTYSGSDVAIPKGYHAGGGKVGVAGGNKGAWGSTINPGGSVTIPKGYHNGSGVVKANGNSINFHPIDRTVGWGSGVRFTGEDATPGASGKMRFVLKYWCRTEYNVNGYIKVLRNGSEIHSTTFNKHYDSPYNDDVPNGYINIEFSGSGTYQIQVSVDYNAGNGEIKMGGAFIGY